MTELELARSLGFDDVPPKKCRALLPVDTAPGERSETNYRICVDVVRATLQLIVRDIESIDWIDSRARYLKPGSYGVVVAVLKDAVLSPSFMQIVRNQNWLLPKHHEIVMSVQNDGFYVGFNVYDVVDASPVARLYMGDDDR